MEEGILDEHLPFGRGSRPGKDVLDRVLGRRGLRLALIGEEQSSQLCKSKQDSDSARKLTSSLKTSSFGVRGASALP